MWAFTNIEFVLDYHLMWALILAMLSSTGLTLYTIHKKLLTPCRLLHVLFLFHIMDSTCGWIPIVIGNP
jgi:hypothetical protein